MEVTVCPNCKGRELYRTNHTIGSGNGFYSPVFLPGLGGLIFSGKFHIVVCRDCGLTRFFADERARKRLPDSPLWTACSVAPDEPPR